MNSGSYDQGQMPRAQIVGIPAERVRTSAPGCLDITVSFFFLGAIVRETGSVLFYPQ